MGNSRIGFLVNRTRVQKEVEYKNDVIMVPPKGKTRNKRINFLDLGPLPQGIQFIPVEDNQE